MGILIAAAVSFGFLGCNLHTGGETATLTVSLDRTAGSRVIGADVDTVRLYLIHENGAFYQFPPDEAIYKEFAVTETVQVEVPAGNWKAALELGEKLSSGALYPINFGVSGLTAIAPGVENTVAITGENTPFVWSEAEAGTDFNGAVTIDDGVDSFVYASSGSKLYSGSGVTALSEISPAFNYAEYAINSISEGTYFKDGSASSDPPDYELWVNTDRGIVPFRDGVFQYGFQTSEFPVLKSGGYFEEQEAPDIPSRLTIFYKTPTAFGGLDVSNTYGNDDINSLPDPSTWTWNNNSDFEGTLTGELIYEFFIHDGATYFASKLGAFRMDNSVTANGGGDFIGLAQKIEIAGEEAESAIPIFGLEYLPTGKILLATESGVFAATLTSDASVFTDLAIIPGTSGTQFTKTAVSYDGSYAAAVSSTGVFIFKKSGDSFVYKDYPVYTGLPGSISAIEFMEGSSVLIVAGKSGLLSPDGGIAQVDAASLPW